VTSKVQRSSVFPLDWRREKVRKDKRGEEKSNSEGQGHNIQKGIQIYEKIPQLMIKSITLQKAKIKTPSQNKGWIKYEVEKEKTKTNHKDSTTTKLNFSKEVDDYVRWLDLEAWLIVIQDSQGREILL